MGGSPVKGCGGLVNVITTAEKRGGEGGDGGGWGALAVSKLQL